MPSKQRHHRPQEYGKDNDNQRADDQRQLQPAAFIPRRFLSDHERKVNHANQIPRTVAFEREAVLIVDIAKHHRTDLAEFYWIAAHILQVGSADRAILVSKHFYFSGRVQDGEDRGVRSAAPEIPAGDCVSILGGCGDRLLLWKLNGIVTVKKCVPHRLACPHFSFPRAVVGDKESHLRIGDRSAGSHRGPGSTAAAVEVNPKECRNITTSRCNEINGSR